MNGSDWFVPLLLAAGVLLGSLIVRRFVPKKRHQVRRLVILIALVLLVRAAQAIAAAVFQDPLWPSRIGVVASTAEIFTVIQLAALFLLDLGLQLLRIEVPRIMTDIIVGLAYFIAVLSVLREGGVELAPVLAGGAIVSAVLALSLQPTLGNLLGGVALQLDGSIHVGDWIMLESGKQGRVREIRWRHTIVETRDSSTLVVPNSALLSSTITIFGRREGAAVPHRMWVHFHVDFRFSPAQVCEVVQEGLRRSAIALVATDPPPSCVCLDFAREGRDSYALYAVRFYLTDLAQDDPTASRVRARVWSSLERAGIPLARPARTLFVNDETHYQQRRETRHREDRLGALGKVELFRGLTDEERAALESHLVRVPYVAGELVTKQGAVAHWLYILIEGEVEVRLPMPGAEPKRVATVTAPGFFGEMGLMTGEPRQADVVALTDVVCFRLDKAAFESTVQSRPELAEELSTLLARRRVGLLAVRDGLGDSDRSGQEASEASRILGRIREFFCLDD